MEDKKIKRINRILNSIEKDVGSKDLFGSLMNMAYDEDLDPIDESILRIKKIKKGVADSENIEEVNRKLKILSKMIIRYI